MSFVRPLVLTVFLPFLAWCQAPGLVYSRVLPVLSSGITTSGTVRAIAVDGVGNTYLAGSTENAAFPVTPGAPQTTFGGGTCTAPTYNPLLPPTTYPCDDAFVLELDPHGNVVFGTYLGGPAFDQATSIAVDSAGNIYVAGASGRNFPTTPGSPFGGSATASVFLAKINPATGLVYSYPIPGLSGKVTLALDAQGSVYFAGDYSGFATTPGALQGKGGIVVGKLNAAGTKLVYGAQFGGTNGVLGEEEPASPWIPPATRTSPAPLAPPTFRPPLGHSKPPCRTASTPRLSPSSMPREVRWFMAPIWAGAAWSSPARFGWTRKATPT